MNAAPVENVDIDDEEEEEPGVKPVHAALIVCRVANEVSQNVFITREGLDTLDKFARLDDDKDVTEMAKRMGSRSSVATRHP